MPQWLKMELTLEGELHRERGRRAIENADDLAALKDLATALFDNWCISKHLLNQHVKRVIELELEVANAKPKLQPNPGPVRQPPHPPQSPV